MPPAYRQSPTDLSLSPAPSASSPNPSNSSQVYEPDHPSFISEGQSTTSSTLDHVDADSLLDASPEEVEARALELLSLNSHHLPPPPPASSTGATGTTARTEEVTATIHDIPRRVPTSGEGGQVEGEAQAVAFLRKALNEAEETDWQYNTPAVFGPPRVLDSRPGHGGNDEDTSRLADWIDTAFNRESFQDDDEQDASGAYELEESHGALDFGDAAPIGFEGGYGTPYVREGEADPAGHGVAGGVFA